MTKNIYCTLDTETFGGASNPKGIYHVAGLIHDRDGVIIAPFNYLIAEHYDEIEKDSYAKKNFYRYLEMVENGEITVVDTEETAINAIDALCDYYNVKYMMAYNSAFDFTKTMCCKLIENREFIDIYLMTLQTITGLKKYAKFCRENGFRSSSGKSVATTAESVFAFLTNNVEYKEEHTALEDSKIEMQIFLACLKTHKKYTKNCHAWDCKENKYYPKWIDKKEIKKGLTDIQFEKLEMMLKNGNDLTTAIKIVKRLF